MTEEEITAEPSSFSYIWYTAVWYLVQFLVILALHFRVRREVDKKILQKAAFDTLLLAVVFLSLQYAQRCLSCAIYRLPYVVIHLFVDLIPTALWIGTSQLLLLTCLGLAQKLYNHLTGTKTSTSAIASHLTMSYFTSLHKSQDGLEKMIRKHITKQYPKLAQKLDEPVPDSQALTLLFKSASLLLQLSTLGLAFVTTFWSAVKDCYRKAMQQRMKYVKADLYELTSILSVTVFATAWIEYTAAVSAFRLAKRTFKKQVMRSSSCIDKSMKTNNEPSATEHADTTNSTPSGHEADADQFKQHED